MLGLVEKTGADAQLNRADAAAARRVQRSDLRCPPHPPVVTLILPADGTASLTDQTFTWTMTHQMSFG
jgi:hypothetical protein